MNKKKLSYLTLLLFILIGLYTGYKHYNKSYTKTTILKTETIIDAKTLSDAFFTNEEKSNKKYTEKVIEVNGVIKKISFLNNRYTVILEGKSLDSSIICDFESDQLEKIKKLTPNQKISIKGICKGFLKDVILLNCILINTSNNE